MSFGTLHTDESVFAFVLEWKSRKLSNGQGKSNTLFTVFWCIVPFRHIAITGVGYCLFVQRLRESLHSDKRKMLHTFL